MKVFKCNNQTYYFQHFISKAIVIIEKTYLITHWFVRNNKIHSSKFSAVSGIDNPKTCPEIVYAYYYKDCFYGNDKNFTNKSWKKFAKKLKHEEKLRIFK